ncbi:protein YABBY 7-like [Lolium rigidum]|uniref:protein YABBY 7-like n=1 Tax=Lolium rigidum TaxID=89674 RepID=UPI001F5E0F3D|nr:protein YABBY 7-like [Lolium rigidum]
MSSVSLGIPERLGYVQCKFCTTILLVSVPCSSLLLKMVAVQCGRCSGILSVSVASPPPSPPSPSSVELPLQELGVDPPPREWSDESSGADDEWEGQAVENNAAAVNKPPVRKQRTPSAYNCFIKEEIKRIKAVEPKMTHKEAFSTAAKNWAHLPRIQHKGD